MDDDIDEFVKDIMGREATNNKEDNTDYGEVRLWRDGSSVEISQTSTGKFSFTVKVNDQDVDKAAAEANRIVQELRKTYGADSGTKNQDH